MWLSMAFPLKNDMSAILLVFISCLFPKEVKELSRRGRESPLHPLEVVPNSKTFHGTSTGTSISGEHLPFPVNDVLWASLH